MINLKKLNLRKINPKIMNQSGVGIPFVIMVVLALSLMAATVVISGKFVYDEKAIRATQELLQRLALAISSTNYQSAPKSVRSYEQDVGHLPAALADLQTKPGGDAACSIDTTARSLTGWCGPYWKFSFTAEGFNDAWGHTLTYNTSSRFIRSLGPDNSNNSGANDDITQGY